jgi:YebC/PmpR family DNA-binding regulatory protein
MAGHSKWAQIKRAKAVTDSARARVFTRFAKQIALESKRAGGSLSDPALAALISRAKAANMPKDNIERAVAKGASKDSGGLERVVYECYGPGGAAILIDALTDSRNRTTQEIKHLLSKNGYELGSPGSAMWAFAKHPSGAFSPNEPLIDLAEADADALSTLLTLLDEYEDTQTVYTNARGYESTENEDAE